MIGRSLSHFLIVDKIGEGGMGVVYRARDTHLERDVAVKVLPAGMLAEDNARRRFRNEALALSKLNHPNIESVYEFGNEEGVDFLVMEHLEGETLAARLGKGPLPLGFIVRTGGEILAGLEAAHREGLVHRDLKPGNIMLTRSGAKLLDFGLAKDLQERPGAAGLTAAPTATSPLTAGGAIVGTFQYMAPEQLEGKPADPRSDLFAFGAVLYEMASGRKAFEGKSQASLIAAILKEEPRPISSLQPASPPALDRLVRACLAKDPAERIQSARDARIALEWIADAAPSEATPTPVERGRGRREAIAWGVSLVLALAAGGLALRPSSRPETNERLVRFTVQPPKGPQASQGPGGTGAIEMTLSPDGKHLILGSPDDRGRDMLWVRSLDRLDARPLAGTEEARYPFWSPDGTQVGFFVDGFLKKVSFPGGAAQVVCRAPTGRGGAWNRDGVILFSADKYGPLFRVSAEGGEPAAVTEDRSKDGVSHRWPQFLPDQDHFIYVVSARSAEASGLFVGSLGSKESKPILAGLSDEISNSMFVPPGYLVFGRNHTLMAQPFDAAALRLTGGPVTLTDAPIGVNLARNFAAFSVSGNGVLAFQPDEVAPSRLVWLDRSGRQVGAFASAAYYSSPRISPDGQRVALIRHETHDEAGDLWVYDLARDGITRMTFDPGTFGAAAWLPGGRRIAIGGRRGLFLKDGTGAGAEELLHESVLGVTVDDVSADGRQILFKLDNAQTQQDLWILPLEGERSARPLLQTKYNEGSGRFSPDGRWLAYVSTESGRQEVYVRPFPAIEAGRWQVSTSGGIEPRWRRDGREFYYLAQDSTLMSVKVTPGSTFAFGAPQPIFRFPPSTLADDTVYDVSPDGNRFLACTTPGSIPPPTITVVLDWIAALKP